MRDILDDSLKMRTTSACSGILGAYADAYITRITAPTKSLMVRGPLLIEQVRASNPPIILSSSDPTILQPPKISLIQLLNIPKTG